MKPISLQRLQILQTCKECDVSIRLNWIKVSDLRMNELRKM